jgi:hypothetical protein
MDLARRRELRSLTISKTSNLRIYHRSLRKYRLDSESLPSTWRVFTAEKGKKAGFAALLSKWNALSDDALLMLTRVCVLRFFLPLWMGTGGTPFHLLSSAGSSLCLTSHRMEERHAFVLRNGNSNH